jgi:hypothetical protein
MIKIIVELDKTMIAKVAEEYENNQSDFVKFSCEKILQKVSKVTQKMSDTAKEINTLNPLGVPKL